MIVILGKTCSGKDTIVSKLVEKYNYKRIISYTTRPMRQNEIQDKTYHFISKEEFLSKIDSDFFLEYKKYKTIDGDWYYGSAKEDYKSSDNNTIIILTPDGLRDLKRWVIKNNINIDIISIYIYANKETIMKRLKWRGDKTDEAMRRLKSDDKDFENIENLTDRTFYNISYNGIDHVAESIHRYVNQRKDKKFEKENLFSWCNWVLQRLS